MATYDQAERARLYREAQRGARGAGAGALPVGRTSYDAVRSAVTTVDGPLDLDGAELGLAAGADGGGGASRVQRAP